MGASAHRRLGRARLSVDRLGCWAHSGPNQCYINSISYRMFIRLSLPLAYVRAGFTFPISLIPFLAVSQNRKALVTLASIWRAR